MSTTNIQPLVDVGARMKYTELGDGAQFHDNVEHGTNRIAAELGSMESRDAFAEYCRDVRKGHSGRKNEGYELRISWSPDELSIYSKDDVQQAIDHTYLVCKEVAPESHYWLTAHTDGDGGCVHVHACICNQNESTGKALSHGMIHSRVAAINDDVSRQWNMHVIGPSKESGKTWEERREECDSFEQALGDKVQAAREVSKDVDEFRGNLEQDGVQLVERTKVDDDGVEHTGWTYKMREPGGKRRMRRRQAQKLCDEFTREGTEAYFAQKQAQIAAPTHVQQGEPYEGNEEAYRLFETYSLENGDVADNLIALDEATEGYPSVNSEVRRRLHSATRFREEVQADVDKAREEFRAAKDFKDRMRKEKAPSLMALKGLFGMMTAWSDDPVQRMFDRMMERMMAMLASEAIRREQQREQEVAERRLYEARRKMWDAEKRQKAAEDAFGELVADGQFVEPEQPDVRKKPVEVAQEPVKAPEEPRKPRVLPSQFEDLAAQEQAETVSLDGLSRKRDDPGE